MLHDNNLYNHTYRMVEKVGSSVSMPCIAARQQHQSNISSARFCTICNACIQRKSICLELLTLDEKLDLQFITIYYHVDKYGYMC